MQGDVDGQQLDALIAANDDAKQKVSQLVADDGLRLVGVGPLSGAQQLEQLGFLHISIQQPLGLGFGSTIKLHPLEPSRSGDRGAMNAEQAAPKFERDIHPLFRQEDVSAMSCAFDLASYEDVRTNAEAIYQRLADGSIPSDSRWTAEQVERFRAWIDTGSPP